MGYYSSPKAMFEERAKKKKKEGDVYWAKAKEGQGDQYYGYAKNCYKKAAENEEKAKTAKDSWK